ncbi:unnamed protein product [Lactuca saligna]|uniref:Uncharacterized protein n=1 Tax=Lactuca saligna TaxID=75948 RepID=A0AA35UYC0_LACSI|nr:unnamed protein product [Lactuca saligna]
MSEGAPGSLEDSCQCGKPSLIDGTGTSSHSLYFESYTLGWANTRDSLLSKDTTAQEWRMMEEARDSEVERQVLTEKNFMVAYEKAALEDQMATLGTDRSDLRTK